MSYVLKRHPLPMKAYLRRSLVLTYAIPEDRLKHLLNPGVTLDTHEGYGFFVVAMVQSEGLRPSLLPRVFGTSFFLAGYRLFVRYTTIAGKKLRGLQILRSEADSKRLVRMGNLLTHYNYRLVKTDISLKDNDLSVRLQREGRTTLDVVAHLDRRTLPPGSIFRDAKDARRFAGPMPFTFDFERQTRSMIRIEGVRQDWDPQLVEVEVRTPPNFEEFGLPQDLPGLVSAFHIHDVPYRWKRGVTERLP